jgi:hypothetical protein
LGKENYKSQEKRERNITPLLALPGKLLGKSSYPLNSISALFKVYLMFFGTTSVIVIMSGMFSSDRNRILNSSILFNKLYPFIDWELCTPYNRLSGQQMLSGIQIISTSHGMTSRNFFDVFLPFCLLFGF